MIRHDMNVPLLQRLHHQNHHRIVDNSNSNKDNGKQTGTAIEKAKQAQTLGGNTTQDLLNATIGPVSK